MALSESSASRGGMASCWNKGKSTENGVPKKNDIYYIRTGDVLTLS